MALMRKAACTPFAFGMFYSILHTNEEILPIKLKCRLLLGNLNMRGFRFAHFLRL